MDSVKNKLLGSKTNGAQLEIYTWNHVTTSWCIALTVFLMSSRNLNIITARTLCRGCHVQDPLRGSDLRIPSHVGGPTIHAHGCCHLCHANTERVGGERRLGRRCLSGRGGHLHREVLHRGRPSSSSFYDF